MAKVFYIKPSILWAEFKTIIRNAGVKGPSNTTITVADITQRPFDFIEVTPEEYSYVSKESMRYRPCIIVDESFIAQMKLLSNNSEVLITWLLDQ